MLSRLPSDRRRAFHQANPGASSAETMVTAWRAWIPLSAAVATNSALPASPSLSKCSAPGLITATGVPSGKLSRRPEVGGSSRHIDAAACQDRPTSSTANETAWRPRGAAGPKQGCVLPDFRQGPLNAEKLHSAICRSSSAVGTPAIRAASSHSDAQLSGDDSGRLRRQAT